MIECKARCHVELPATGPQMSRVNLKTGRRQALMQALKSSKNNDLASAWAI